MDYIIEEIKQHDNEFIRISNDNELFKSHKLYIVGYKFNNIFDYISIKSGNKLIQHKDINFESERLKIEIYEIERDGELGIKSIHNIFHNFCINYLSNNYLLKSFTPIQNYIVFDICIVDHNINFKNYFLRYCTVTQHEEYEKALVINNIENFDKYNEILTINNIDGLDKYYDVINNFNNQNRCDSTKTQMQKLGIFLKIF